MLSVWRSVCDADDVASFCHTGFSFCWLVTSVCPLGSQDKVWGPSGASSVLIKSVQALLPLLLLLLLLLLLTLLLDSVVATYRLDISGSVDGPCDLLPVSVNVCVCSLSVGQKQKRKKCGN